MIVNIATHTDGKGPNTDEKRLVIINQLKIGYSSLIYFPDDPFHGVLRAYFEPHGFTQGSWNTEGFGLIHSDKLWIREFKKSLRDIGFSIMATRNISYSALELQNAEYVSLDVGPAFYKSWKRISNIILRSKNEGS